MDGYSEYELEFSDQTMVETEGKFESVKKKMLSEEVSSKWVVVTYASISSVDVESQDDVFISKLLLEFYHNKDIIIVDSQSSFSKGGGSFDLQFLCAWSQDNGWNIPKPSQSLVMTNKEYWTRAWETGLIKSDYLDQIKSFKKN